MTDVSFGDLVVRMIVSLAIVLGLMFGAYWIMRKRQGFAPSAMPRGRRSGSGRASGGVRALLPRSTAPRLSGGSAKSSGNRRGLRVVGRVGVGRTTQIVAVQFAEKVFLLGACDQTAPSVLAELDLAAWLAATEAVDDESVQSIVREPIGSVAAPRPGGLLDSLREATTRRG
jgi:flagellar biogenesis protein FliO